MSGSSCCSSGKPSRLHFARQSLRASGFLLPGAILALMPKCPACFAGYFAVATGVGISMATASYLRMGLLIFCLAALACMAAKLARGRMRSWIAARRASLD